MFEWKQQLSAQKFTNSQCIKKRDFFFSVSFTAQPHQTAVAEAAKLMDAAVTP